MSARSCSAPSRPAFATASPSPSRLSRSPPCRRSSLYYPLGDPLYPLLVSSIVLCGALGAIASRWPSAAPAALIAGVVAVATVMLLPAPDRIDLGLMQIGALSWTILGDQGLGRFALKSAAIAFVVGVGSIFERRPRGGDRAASPPECSRPAAPAHRSSSSSSSTCATCRSRRGRRSALPR